MTQAVLKFLTVDWPAASALCMAFRSDAWLVSYGNLDGFSESETLAWFDVLVNKYPQGFLHVWQAGKVIGQIEYRAPLSGANGEVGAYINLFYLLPKNRHLGLGSVLHDYVIEKLRTQGCTEVRLRVIPGNTAAERFYARHGWQLDGIATDKGQLMVLRLSRSVKNNSD